MQIGKTLQLGDVCDSEAQFLKTIKTKAVLWKLKKAKSCTITEIHWYHYGKGFHVSGVVTYYTTTKEGEYVI